MSEVKVRMHYTDNKKHSVRYDSVKDSDDSKILRAAYFGNELFEQLGFPTHETPPPQLLITIEAVTGL